MAQARTGVNVILGAGPLGRAVMSALLRRGEGVRMVTRSGEAPLPLSVEHVAADLTDPDAAARACAGAKVVYGCAGLNYVAWQQWPALLSGMLAGAEAARAPLIFADNLYMYGPHDGPLRENLPLSGYGVKPALRTLLTRMWQQAHAAGRVRVAAVRASDFYGPGVTWAVLGDYVTGMAVKGKPAQLLGDPALAHSFTYVPDFARALISVAEAGDDALGQAWHVPNAPARPLGDVVALIYRLAGREPRYGVAPPWRLCMAGMFNGNVRELKEMLYQWNQPFVVDHRKFAARFWGDPTPLEQGLKATVEWYQRAVGRERLAA